MSNLKTKVIKEPFDNKQHILFTQLSALSYEPPLGFLLGANYLGTSPKKFNENADKKLRILNYLIDRGIKKGLYCGMLKSTNKDIHGFFVGNNHDLNCYIIRLKKTDPNIYVVFRGTTSTTQWKSNLSVLFDSGDIPNLLQHFAKESEGRELLMKLITLHGKPVIYPGFAGTLFSSLDIINNCVTHLIKEKKGESNIYITGHSLGGALGTLYGFSVAYALSERHGSIYKLRKQINLPINVCSLGSPKVGNQDFSTIYNALIEVGLIRYDRCISVSKFVSDPITTQPADLATWVTGIKGHPGFSEEKKLSCKEITDKINKNELSVALMTTSDLPAMIQEHCALEKGVKLTHPGGGNVVVVEATKDESKDCPGFMRGNIHGLHGFGLCHAWYFGISFTHLAGYAVIRRNALARWVYHMGEFQSVIGILSKGAVATKVVGDKIDKETMRFMDHKTLDLLCQRDQENLV